MQGDDNRGGLQTLNPETRQVMSAASNFVRVEVQQLEGATHEVETTLLPQLSRRLLLCNLRAVLKKLDKVRYMPRWLGCN